MYQALGDKHVQLLTASIRTLDHLLYAIKLKSNIVTVPYRVLETWKERGFELPKSDYVYDIPGLQQIPYKTLTLDNSWWQYNIKHDLTDQGVKKFWDDWHSRVS